MEPVNIFGGKGFVGSAYADKFTNCVLNDRNDYVPKTNNILYFISTVDNYNVFHNPHLDIETNLNTLINVLTNIKDRENTVFNFISSWFVYGDTDLPAKETSYCNPKGFYSITKRAAEQLLISYCQTFGIKYRILRLANVIGINDKKVSNKKNAIIYLIKSLHENEPIKLYEGGQLYRDVIDVDDCIAAINLVIEKGEVNEIYNIGNGTPVLLYDIVMQARQMLRSTSEITYIDTPLFHKTIQVKSMYMDNSKLKSLGYIHQHDTTSILQRIIDKL